ncbi:MerC domain-containing protein [Corallincola platygyrae]|uniref:MerC domain-containing protein n=1 Tax=Corallincola platygyrae TaxID=1193278 RepID=A0ABW4XS20_9GAMM
MNVKTQTLDRFAIGVSLLCAIHCALLPVAIAMIPAMAGTMFADESFHMILVGVVLPTSALALLFGCRKHGHWRVLGWGAAGLLSLVLALVIGHDVFGEFGEKGMTLLGSAMVAYGHIQNFRFCRVDKCQH